MMIIWRNGKAGFVGGIKRLIGGFFDVYHSATSSAPTSPTITSYYTIHSRVTTIRSVGRAQNIGVTTK